MGDAGQEKKVKKRKRERREPVGRAVGGTEDAEGREDDVGKEEANQKRKYASPRAEALRSSELYISETKLIVRLHSGNEFGEQIRQVIASLVYYSTFKLARICEEESLVLVVCSLVIGRLEK
ncbi:hypothetical protein V1477_009711 [Vespula maculifrons]|uniref:Uncharacterized protein n=1 Tax=Vespula maculifrons TaxID=7453 RepID=A0ABD2CAM7_VESMC